MGFGKVAISFLLLAVFAMSMVAMAAVMVNDKPTDSYYTDPNHTAKGSVSLVGTMFGVTNNLMIPLLGIAGILVLFAGFVILRKV